MNSIFKKLVMCAVAGALVGACGVTPNVGTPSEQQAIHLQTQDALSQFEQADYSFRQRLESAYAYAIFPDVITAAVGVGGAHGNGEVYAGGRLIGYADLSQGNIGVQLGAQKFAEVVLFENAGSLSDFQRSTLEFDARASAVAAASGAAATADYSKGVLVFTLPQSGLMVQAAIGGQKFRYTSAGDVPVNYSQRYSSSDNAADLHTSNGYAPNASPPMVTPPNDNTINSPARP